MRHLHPILVLALLFLTGCTPQANQKPATLAPSYSPTTTTSPLPISSPTPVATITPENTLTMESDTPTPFPVTEAPPLLPTATTGAMQLFFPTFIPVKGAQYRPSLYPIPWAPSPYDHFYFSAPIAAAYPGNPELDYLYGGAFFAPDVIHTGVDLPAPRGTEVLAAGPGTVVWAGIGLFTGSSDYLKDPYGLAVAIRHDFGYQDKQLYTIYAHMDEVDVTAGQWLKTGDVVGKVGNTGNTTGPHLHFEVRLGDNSFYATRNPELWIAPPQGYGVLVGRVMNEFGTILKNQLIILKNIQTGTKYTVNTYASDTTIHSDAYYNENLVLGDLPAGVYELNIPFAGGYYLVKIQVLPGQVTYFAFYGFAGYSFKMPSASPGATPSP